MTSFEIVNFLLKTNDGRGGRPDWVILSAAYASAKTWGREGSIYYTASIWRTVISNLVYLVCCIGSGK